MTGATIMGRDRCQCDKRCVAMQRCAAVFGPFEKKLGGTGWLQQVGVNKDSCTRVLRG